MYFKLCLSTVAYVKVSTNLKHVKLKPDLPSFDIKYKSGCGYFKLIMKTTLKHLCVAMCLSVCSKTTIPITGRALNVAFNCMST